MAYTVKIDGVSQVPPLAIVEAGSLSLEGTVGRRSQAAFNLKTADAIHIRDYQQVTIYDNSNALVFSGYITTPKEEPPGFQPTLEHTISCCDQHYLADKRVVAASFTNRTCGWIAQWLVTNILAQEGVTIGQIYDGLEPSPTLYPSSTLYPQGNVGLIPQAIFVYCTAAQALDALVQQASAAGIPYYWMIDLNKKLWFVPYTAVVNSSVIDGTRADDGRLTGTKPSCTRANPKYRNTQYVLGGVAQTVQQNETIVGDGNKRSFPMGFALASAPTIVIGGVTQTVAIKGSSGAQWYWAQGDDVLVQDSGQAPIANGATGTVTYIGQYPSVAIAQSGGDVTARANLDGTSGIVEAVATDNTLTSVSSGLSAAGQLLTRYVPDGVILQFATQQTGFAAGQIVTVNWSRFGLYNASMLIEDVRATDSLDGLNIWFVVTAIQGPYDNNWTFFYAELVKQNAIANSINIGVNQQLTILASFTASVSPTATLTSMVTACPLPSLTLYPSPTLYPC